MGSVPSSTSLRRPGPVASPVLPLPALVAHADWSLGLGGRWLARARLRPDGSYLASAPEPAGEGTALLARLREEAEGGTVLLGVDFPIGLPEPFARLAGVADFAAWLRAGPPESWFTAAASPEEIAPLRPFYPRSRGAARRAHLVEGLGIGSYAGLLRLCDRLTDATCMFWTMGPQQCGKAAQAGWRELARPVALEREAGLWPFEGGLSRLLAERRLVLAETYPAECYGQVLSIKGRFSKQRRDDRLALAPRSRRSPPSSTSTSGRSRRPWGAASTTSTVRTTASTPRSACWPCSPSCAAGAGTGRPTRPPSRSLEGWMLGLSTTPTRAGSSSAATAP